MIPGRDVSAAELSAAEAARSIADGRLSSEVLVRACLERIELRDGDVQAWAWCDADAALAQARERDAWSGVRGPLHGVPIGIKDVLDTVDMPTGYGSAIYAGHRPAWDAACVSQVRAAGAVVLGKTATAEFANIHPTATCNPHNLMHTPGGSSSGSAAAVADCMVPLALGTQTAGSTIRPAAYCGIVGYKPTFGLISRAGLKLVAESLDTIGLFGRSVEDVALLMHAMTGLPPLPRPGRDVAVPPRIGVYRPAAWLEADAASRDLLGRSALDLSAAGAQVLDVEARLDDGALDSSHGVIMNFESARCMAYEMLEKRAAISAALLARLDSGLKITLDVYRIALRETLAARLQFNQMMLSFDVLITLSAPGTAPLGQASTGASTFNRVWTLMGAPCVNLPCGVDPNGLPMGIQVIGACGEDSAMLTHARWISTQLLAPEPPAQ